MKRALRVTFKSDLKVHDIQWNIFSTARCSSSRNSLRGIHPSIHPVDILVAVLPPALMVFFTSSAALLDMVPLSCLDKVQSKFDSLWEQIRARFPFGESFFRSEIEIDRMENFNEKI